MYARFGYHEFACFLFEINLSLAQRYFDTANIPFLIILSIIVDSIDDSCLKKLQQAINGGCQKVVF
jgi:hypothetical protein